MVARFDPEHALSDTVAATTMSATTMATARKGFRTVFPVRADHGDFNTTRLIARPET
jgi:hypothetical protein